MRIQYGATVVSFLVVELLLTGNNTRVRINNQPICKNCDMQSSAPIFEYHPTTDREFPERGGKYEMPKRAG